MSKYHWIDSGDPDWDDLESLQAEAYARMASASTRQKGPSPFGKVPKEHSMKLELGIMAGAESKAWLVDLTKQIDRLERLTGGKGLKAEAAATDDADDAPAESDDDDQDFAPAKATKAAAKKTAASFDDDDADDAPAASTDDDDDDADFTAPAKPAKAAKAKKLTVDDVNDACKARASATGGKKGRAEVLAILKKKFKTESVSDLKPEQYAACVEAMAV